MVVRNINLSMHITTPITYLILFILCNTIQVNQFIIQKPCDQWLQ